ncbi:hypothetical protein RYX36_034891 [Vicia faba]
MNEVMSNDEKPKHEPQLTQWHSSDNEEEVDAEKGKEEDDDKEEKEEEEDYLKVDLSSIRKDIKCPICLGA